MNLTCISLSDTLAKWDPSADLAEFWGLIYKFWSTIVWKQTRLIITKSIIALLSNYLRKCRFVVDAGASFAVSASSDFEEEWAIDLVLFCTKNGSQILGHNAGIMRWLCYYDNKILICDSFATFQFCCLLSSLPSLASKQNESRQANP